MSGQPVSGLAPLSRLAGFAVFLALADFFWSEAEREKWPLLLGLCALLVGLAAWLRPPAGLLPPNPNYSACVLAAAFAAALGLLGVRGQGSERRGIGYRNWGVGIVMAGAAAGLCLVGSRGAWLGVGAALAVGAWRRGPRSPAALLLAGGLAFLAFAPGRVLARKLKLGDPASLTRASIWKASFAALAAHPLLGAGLGGFERAFLRHNFPKRRGAAFYGRFADHAPSGPLELAVETGIAGLLLAAAALWIFLDIPPPPEPSAAREAGLCAAAAIAAQSLVDNLFVCPALGLLFFSALACAAKGSGVRGQGLEAGEKGEGRGEKKEPRPSASSLLPSPSHLTLPTMGLRFFCVGMAIFSLLAWVPEAMARSALARLEAERPPLSREGAERLISIAEFLWPRDCSARARIAEALLSRGRPSRALAEIGRACRLCPRNGIYWLMQAELLKSLGRPRRALGCVDKALALEPFFLEARLARAEILAAEGRRADASTETRRIRSLIGPLSHLSPRSGYEAALLRFDKAGFRRLSRALSAPARPRSQRHVL